MLDKGNEDASMNTSIVERKKVHSHVHIFSTMQSFLVELITCFQHNFLLITEMWISPELKVEKVVALVENLPYNVQMKCSGSVTNE